MKCPQCGEPHDLSDCPRWKMSDYRLLPVALAPHIKDAIRASGHFMPESLWASIIAAHDLVGTICPVCAQGYMGERCDECGIDAATAKQVAQQQASTAQEQAASDSGMLVQAIDACDACMDVTQVEPEDAAAWQVVRAALVAPAHALTDAEWQPIETAPKGAAGYSWMMLKWGSEDEPNTGAGMRCGDKFFAAATFHCLGKEKRYEFREVEVSATHWMPMLDSPRAIAAHLARKG